MLGRFSSGSLKYWNLTTPGGQTVGRVRPSGAVRYYIKDHLGSIRAVIDPTQPQGNRVVEARDYYPFGLRMPGRSMSDGVPAVDDYTGHELDEETGLVYAGARYYMSALGRWTATDPLADAFPGHSPYNYALNNPTGLTDPTGMAPEDCPDCVNPDNPIELPGVVVTAERPEGAGAFVSGNTFYFNSSTRAGRSGLYDFMRSNPGATRQMIGNNDYSMRAQQIAFNANIYNGQALFLNNTAQLLSYASLLTGTGVGVLGGRLLLTSSAKVLTSTRLRITALEQVTTRLSFASSGAYAASGDSDAAISSFGGALIGRATTLFRAAQATRGLRAAPKVKNVLYRNDNTGRFVENSVYGSRYGIQTVGSTVAGPLTGVGTGYYFVQPSK